MQAKTLLALFCTIVILFIGVNDGAPTKPVTTKTVTPTPTKAVTTKTVAPTPTKAVATKTVAPTPTPTTTVVTTQPPKLAGSRTPWKTKIDPKSKKLFNDYKKAITKKLQSVHKVAAKFNPKPQKVSTQIVSGTLYHYLVKLPNKKLAYVTILDRSWKKDLYGNEEHVTVRPQLYNLNDKNI